MSFSLALLAHGILGPLDELLLPFLAELFVFTMIYIAWIRARFKHPHQSVKDEETES